MNDLYIIQIISIQHYLRMDGELGKNQRTQKHIKVGSCHYCVKTDSQLFTERDKELYRGRTSQEQKLRLINLVTTQNYKIKDASKIVKITYSTAKKIFTKFRKTFRSKLSKMTEKSHNEATYSEIKLEQFPNYQRLVIISTIAGCGQTNTEELLQVSDCDC